MIVPAFYDKSDKSIVAFPKEYLEPLMGLTRYAFIKWNRESISVFDAINEYLMNSKIRQGMDKGLPPYLNKGVNQVVNSIDKEKCTKDEEQVLDSVVYFLADVYTYMQWKYNLPSSEICKVLPSKDLAKLYGPLHEMGINKTCERLHNRYFTEKEKGVSLGKD